MSNQAPTSGVAIEEDIADPGGLSTRGRRLAFGSALVVIAALVVTGALWTMSDDERAVRLRTPATESGRTSVALEETPTSAVPDAAPPAPAVVPTTTTPAPAAPALRPAPATAAPSATPWRKLRSAAAVDEPAIYVLEPDGTRLAKLVVDAALVPGGSFSPDGTGVVFIAGDRLETVGLDGTGRRTLVPAGVAPIEPRWSPDGRTIAFLGRDGEGYRLKLVVAGGGEPRTVAPEIADVSAFDWHPDGRTLAFLGGGGIHVARADGSGVDLLHQASRARWQVRWAPTGDRALFTSNGRLCLFDPVAKTQTELALTSGTTHFENRWSPNGRTIAVGLGFRMGLYHVDGRQEFLGQPALSPAWSPDGKSLVVRREQGQRAEGARTLLDLAVIDRAGTSARVILADRADFILPGRDHQWRPQGDLLLFTASSHRPDYPRYSGGTDSSPGC